MPLFELQTPLKQDLKHPGRQSDNFGRMKNQYQDSMVMDDPKMMMEVNGIDADVSPDFNTNYGVLCRPTPYNICYSFDALGNIVPLKRKKPIRVIRVYFWIWYWLEVLGIKNNTSDLELSSKTEIVINVNILVEI